MYGNSGVCLDGIYLAVMLNLHFEDNNLCFLHYRVNISCVCTNEDIMSKSFPRLNTEMSNVFGIWI